MTLAGARERLNTHLWEPSCALPARGAPGRALLTGAVLIALRGSALLVLP
jgi:hypothetical protein